MVVLHEYSGYTVAYDRDDAPFPVYVMAFLAAALMLAWIVTGTPILFLLGAVALGLAYYHFPLLETGRPRLGANQYGLFIEGFGIIQWRAIDRIEHVVFAVRVLTLNELQIALKQPLTTALIADWRNVPWYRMPMRLPWKMAHTNVIRVALDPLEGDPEEICRIFLRMWRHYRS